MANRGQVYAFLAGVDTFHALVVTPRLHAVVNAAIALELAPSSRRARCGPAGGRPEVLTRSRGSGVTASPTG